MFCVQRTAKAVAINGKNNLEYLLVNFNYFYVHQNQQPQRSAQIFLTNLTLSNKYFFSFILTLFRVFDHLSFGSRSLDPGSFDSRSFDAMSFDPMSFDPRSFDPRSFDPIGRLTIGRLTQCRLTQCRLVFVVCRLSFDITQVNYLIRANKDLLASTMICKY